MQRKESRNERAVAQTRSGRNQSYFLRHQAKIALEHGTGTNSANLPACDPSRPTQAPDPRGPKIGEYDGRTPYSFFASLHTLATDEYPVLRKAKKNEGKRTADGIGYLGGKQKTRSDNPKQEKHQRNSFCLRHWQGAGSTRVAPKSCHRQKHPVFNH